MSSSTSSVRSQTIDFKQIERAANDLQRLIDAGMASIVALVYLAVATPVVYYVPLPPTRILVMVPVTIVAIVIAHKSYMYLQHQL